jgi:hypothetical protein
MGLRGAFTAVEEAPFSNTGRQSCTLLADLPRCHFMKPSHTTLYPEPEPEHWENFGPLSICVFYYEPPEEDIRYP